MADFQPKPFWYAMYFMKQNRSTLCGGKIFQVLFTKYQFLLLACWFFWNILLEPFKVLWNCKIRGPKYIVDCGLTFKKYSAGVGLIQENSGLRVAWVRFPNGMTFLKVLFPITLQLMKASCGTSFENFDLLLFGALYSRA